MDETSFFELFMRAWKMTFSYRKAIFFGIVVSASITLQENVFPAYAIGSFSEFVSSIANLAWKEEWLFLGIAIPIIFLLQVFGRANIITAFADGEKLSRCAYGGKNMTRSFSRALLVEIVILCMLILLGAIFSLPVAFAFWHNKNALDGVMLLSLLAFLPILISLLFIRQFSLLYCLLSPLHIRSSFERGSELFSRSLSRSVAFGAFFLIVAFAFTFFLNAAMLGTSVLFEKVGLKIIAEHTGFLVSFAGIAWFSMLQQALWLVFFKDLAGSKKMKKEAVAESVPEFPPA